MSGYWLEKKGRLAGRINKLKIDVHLHKNAVSMEYIAQQIPDLRAKAGLPHLNPYEMLTTSIVRGEFEDPHSGRSKILDLERNRRVTRVTVSTPMIDDSVTTWAQIDYWCDKNRLPRIERWNSSPLSEESSAAPLQVDTSAEPMPPTKEELVTMGCNVLWPNGIPPISELKIHEMITDWVRQKIGDEKYTIGEGTRKRGVKKYREKLEANSLA